MRRGLSVPEFVWSYETGFPDTFMPNYRNQGARRRVSGDFVLLFLRTSYLTYILGFVDRASLHNLANKPN